ncbi:hypothetical protein K438DRAFT_1211087 [Mycena galopus ATCC 62051]|nr:hypothetical protein K438DRAFT_1211087 [Mycena galopus ATCC 62051]
MYLPSDSASNTNGEYTGGGSGNAPRALPVPPGVSANSIAARNAAAAGSYSAGSYSTSRKAGAPRTHHGHSRGGCMGRHAQCRRARVYAHGRDGRGGAEADGRSARPPPRRMRPQSRSPRILFIRVPLLVFFYFRRRGRPQQPLALASRRLHPRCAAPACRAVYEEPGEMEDADEDVDLDAQHTHKNDGTPSHQRRPVAAPFATSSSSASFSSNAASSPFAPKYKQSLFAS